MTGEETKPKAKIPRQIAFIIGNEACERFSFYGMRNILTQFLVSSAILGIAVQADREIMAKEIFHIFVIGVYFFPLIGGWLADRMWGKYKTILWLSLVYCAGNVCLAIFAGDIFVSPEQAAALAAAGSSLDQGIVQGVAAGIDPGSKWGFYLGLLLISVGSGGIKPCVSAFVGEQFDQSNKHLAKIVFDAFYWIINFGSFFASLLIPLVLQSWGPRWAFGIPGGLMFIATVVFWFGRARYVREPPTPGDPHSFGKVCWTALSTSGAGKTMFFVGILVALGCGALPFVTDAVDVVAAICLGFLFFGAFTGIGARSNIDQAKGAHPDEDVEGAKAVFRVLILFALVTPFWSLFDQKASTWVLQGNTMTLPDWSWFKQATQMQALNPLLVMILIPFNNAVLFPLFKKIGLELTQLRKMTLGIGIAGLSWIIIGWYQLRIDDGEQLSVLLQAWPYLVLTLGEVLVSATGLEFAYSQAPMKMKSVIMSFWMLTVTTGQVWVLIVNSTVKSQAVTDAIASTGFGVTAFQMFFFAGFAILCAIGFGLYARKYKTMDYYRKG